MSFPILFYLNFDRVFRRQVTLFEELLLLKDFEKRENVLAAKVDSKQQEKLDMQTRVGPAWRAVITTLIRKNIS